MKKIYKNHISEIVLTAVIFVILGMNFWGQGGILLLDYLSSPHQPLMWYQNGWYMFPQIFVTFLGFEFGSKFFFALILFASAFLGILLARLISEKFSFSNSQILEIFAGIFFLTNPFAYERMMVQPTIYLGIILLWYVIFSLFRFDRYKKYIFAGIFAGISMNLFLHASFMIVLIFGLYIIFFARKKWDFIGIFLAGIVILLLNLNWILAPFFGITNSVNLVSAFNPANFEAFATQALAPMNVWLTNFLLYGFWGERFANHYANVGFLSAFWFIAGLVILAISLFGLYKAFQKSKKIAFAGGILGFLALIFGIGIASPMLRDLTLWMAQNIPMWQWYREPQKWIGVLMLVEGIFFTIGLGAIFSKMSQDIVVKISAIFSVGLLLWTWSPGTFFSYQGQLRTTIYPQDFENLRTELLNQNFSGKILAFPWHSYMGCSWTGRPTIANPIGGLMAPISVVVADNIEVGEILYSNSTSSESQKIEKFLKLHDFSHLNGTDISHILFMKNCADSQNYIFLENISACQKIIDNEFLSFYQCQK